MAILNKLLGKLNGLHYPQEYLCISGEHPSLSFYLVQEGRVAADITRQHVFAGYCPLVFAFHQSATRSSGQIMLLLTERVYRINDKTSREDALALLEMEFLRKMKVSDTELDFYLGTHSHHSFISYFSQKAMQFQNSMYGNRAGNVYLKGNLYVQVQTAYSIPRKISLVTTGGGGSFNLFPTDLHGQVNRDVYLISLRQQGRACRQVQQYRDILLSDMHPGHFKKVYALGKNHMQDPRPAVELPFSTRRSAMFDLPVPEGAVGFKELRLQESFITGIHRILLFSILHHEETEPGTTVLQHVHNCYATWRYRQGSAGNYLLR